MVTVRGIEDRLFPETVDSYSFPEFLWVSHPKRSDVRHLYNAGQDFETPYAAVDDKGRPFYNTDNGLRLEFDYKCISSQTKYQRSPAFVSKF